jgi:hypothetical protein
MPTILKSTNGSPGVTTLNKAGMAMKSENRGMNIHVRFKKNPMLILEQSASSKQSAYRHSKMKRFLVSSICTMNRRKVKVLILGSNDCKRPFLDA